MRKNIEDYVNDFIASLENDNDDSLSSDKPMDRDELLKRLEEIEAAYSDEGQAGTDISELPPLPTYEYKEYDAPTDEEIAKTAESSLSDYRAESIAAIEKAAEEGRQADKEARERAQESAERTAESIDSDYEEASKSLNDDALKRGLARSSIAVNRTADLSSARAEAMASLAVASEQERLRLDSELAALENERTRALDAFDIAYAARVTEKINELTAERTAREEEVLEYNNKLREQEKKDAEDRAELIADLREQALEASENDGVNAEQGEGANKAKYTAIHAYLSTLSRERAKEAVREDALIRNSLTDYYYYKLYNEYGR